MHSSGEDFCEKLVGTMVKTTMLSAVVALLVGCAGPGKRPKPAPPEAVGRKVVPKSRKRSAGRITFAGLADAELAALRVIPEKGKGLRRAVNGTDDQVDGLWWRGERELWFKIPDLSEVWVGRAPENFDGEAHRGPLKIYWRTRSMVEVLGRWSGRVVRPAWVPNEGRTKSPVERPARF